MELLIDIYPLLVLAISVAYYKTVRRLTRNRIPFISHQEYIDRGIQAQHWKIFHNN